LPLASSFVAQKNVEPDIDDEENLFELQIKDLDTNEVFKMQIPVLNNNDIT